MGFPTSKEFKNLWLCIICLQLNLFHPQNPTPESLLEMSPSSPNEAQGETHPHTPAAFPFSFLASLIAQVVPSYSLDDISGNLP